MADKKVTVETPSGSHALMSSDWAMITALLGGTKSMRNAGQAYLPKFDAEPDANYSNRLQRSVLTPYYERTCTFLTGKPFAKPIVIGEDMPEPMKELCEDIDLQGNNLDSFAWKVFFDGVAKGLTHILVDYPQVTNGDQAAPEPTTEGEVARPEAETLADEQEQKPRPYWVHIQAEDLIAAYATMKNGKETLTHVRYKFTEIERVGFEEKVLQYVMVLEPGRWEKWQFDEQAKDWTKIKEGKSDIEEIPLVTFYAGAKDGLMVCKPPLLDLAYLNVTHWQSGSDQRNILTVSRFPSLAASGLDAQAAAGIVIGPNRLIALPDPQAKAYYIEHSGAAIKAGEEDLGQLTEDMQMFGLEMLMPTTGTATATARALDAAEMQSPLQMMAFRFKDCLEQAFVFTGDWMDVDASESGSVSINTEFGLSARVQSDVDGLLKARALQDISRETLLLEFKRRGILSADFDPEEDQAMSDQEEPPLLPGQAVDEDGNPVEGEDGEGGGAPPFGKRPPAKEGEEEEEEDPDAKKKKPKGGAPPFGGK